MVDNLRSTRLTTNSLGDEQFHSDYKPFGVPYIQSGSPIPQEQYTGKMTDTQVASGIYYLGARYYDTNVGRFISEDISTGSLTDPMTLNKYIYARDNPMTFIDPTGNMFAISGGAIGGLSALGRAPAPYVPTSAPSYFSSTASGEPNDAQLTYGRGYFSSTASGEPNDAQLTYGQGYFSSTASGEPNDAQLSYEQSSSTTLVLPSNTQDVVIVKNPYWWFSPTGQCLGNAAVTANDAKSLGQSIPSASNNDPGANPVSSLDDEVPIDNPVGVFIVVGVGVLSLIQDLTGFSTCGGPTPPVPHAGARF